MLSINQNNKSLNSLKKQKGATLFTALVFLTLMTIITVSATKISITDILVASNDHQQMSIFHETENELTDFTATSRLITPLEREDEGLTFGNGGGTVNGVVTDDKTYSFSGAPSETAEIITDLEELYACLRDGVGSSIGPGAPNCRLYDFQIRKTSDKKKSVRDQHHRGAGKMVPNSKSKGSYL